MANTFYRKISRNIGTSATSIGSYTVSANTKVVVLGLTVSNVIGSTIAVDIYINDGSTNTYLVKGAPVSSGGAIIPIGGDQKVVLEANDTIKVRSDSAGSADAILSIMEIT
jgi:hypothetical protein